MMLRPRLDRHRVLQRDAVSEPFELGDEALGLAVGVAAGEVVAAKFLVGDTLVKHEVAGDGNRVRG
jgi:hypothetical protein